MSKMPLISVIMGVYNCEKTLDTAIQSIINQTYENWEFVICDDGSIDNTYNMALSYQKTYPEKFVVIKNPKNMGLNYTLNNCLKYARGKYIARMDGDDISVNSRFEKQIKILNENKDISIVSSAMIYFDENGDWGKSKPVENPTNKNFIYGTPFCHAPCMVRKEAYNAVEGYSVDEKLLRVEDYHLWIKMYEKGYKGFNIKEPLYKMFDGRDAFNRRNYKSRVNEFNVRIIATKKLHLGIKVYIYAFRPLIVGLLPKVIYMKLHKSRKNIN